jgi:hypothetical protein
MPGMERLREALAGSPTLESMHQRMAAGWRLAALEWERPGAGSAEPAREWAEEVPYGLQVSADCAGLVENPAESEVILLALDMIVDDCPLSRVADELNSRGFRDREGVPWSPPALFRLLPRMIQVGPRLFTSEKWTERRGRFPKYRG